MQLQLDAAVTVLARGDVLVVQTWCLLDDDARQHVGLRRADGAGEAAQQRRIDDPPEPVPACDGDPVHGNDVRSGQRAREVLRRARRVDDDQGTGVGRGEQPAFEKARVEAQDRIGALDIAAHADHAIVDAQEGAHRRAASRAAVACERLHVAALGEERHREQTCRPSARPVRRDPG